MQTNFQSWVTSTNSLLQELSNAKSDTERVTSAIALCNNVLSLISTEATGDPDDIIGESVLELPNAERFDTWFQPHPDFVGPKAVFNVLDGSEPALQAKLYWLKKRSNALMAGAVHFTTNWEDAEWSRNANYKVGIDFFLSPNTDSLQIVLSNHGKLRVLELTERLTNTDIEVLEKWHNLAQTNDLDLLHTSIWESFKLQSVNAKFYNGVADAFTELHDQLVADGKNEKEAKMFASRMLGRLIFVWFLRKMNVISPEVSYFDPSGQDQSDYYGNFLERLFFRTLNTPVDEREKEFDGSVDRETPYLNGGLFAPRLDDWVGEKLNFPKEYFVRLFDHFGNFNFTTDESTPEYEQVAIDPEMLGRVFESLLASQLEATGEQARKAKGAFYTPREIVAFMCKEAVSTFLNNSFAKDATLLKSVDLLLNKSDQDWVKEGTNSLRDIPNEHRQIISKSLESLRSIDPACGSGAFPMGILSLLAKLHSRLSPAKSPYETKLRILQQNIFGSDIEPMAVEIARLRSWLSLVVDANILSNIEPLPNLDFNFVAANSLIPLPDDDLFTDTSVQVKLAEIRREYFYANTPEKKHSLQVKFTNLRKPDLIDQKSNLLKTFDPFDSENVAEFFDQDVFFGIQNGFDIVIGNPPYEVLEGKHWSEFSAAIRKIPRYKYSLGGKLNLYRLFIEQSEAILKPNGVLSFIVPSTLISDKSTSGIRRMFKDTGRLYSLIEFPEKSKVFQSVTQATCIFLFVKGLESKGISLSLGLASSDLPPKSSATLSWSEVEAISGQDLAFPLVKDETGLEHIRKIRDGSVNLGMIANIFQGDVNISTSKDLMSNIPTDYLLVRGEHVSAFKVDTSTENVDRRWFNPARIPESFDLARIVMQGISNMGVEQRLIAGKLESSAIIGHSCKYLVIRDTNFSVDFILGLLNSKLLNWYFKKFSTNNNVNGYEIEMLPIKRATGEQQEKVANVVQTMVGLDQTSSEWETQLDELNSLIWDIYEVDQGQILSL